MNPNALKYLESVAGTLPKLVDTKKRVYLEFTGADLIASGMDKDADGFAVNPKKRYLVPTPAYIDHLKHLKVAWKRGKTPDQKIDNVEYYKRYITERFVKKQSNEVPAEPAQA
jgi:hypothetical protein